MLSDDIATAVGLKGGIKLECGFCNAPHYIIVDPAMVTICHCGSVHTISEIDAETVVGVWTSADEIRDKAEQLYNDLPQTQ